MQIARTTVQKIYESARRKLADMLVNGRPLHIEGGEFRLCDGQGAGCGFSACFKQSYHQQYRKPEGDSIMRIAVTYENGQIFQHFGHTAQFKIYDVEDGKIVSSRVVDTQGSGHGALAGVLTALNVDALICGGIGGGAQMALAAANIKLYGGVSGSADAAAEALAAGNLTFDPQRPLRPSRPSHTKRATPAAITAAAAIAAATAASTKRHYNKKGTAFPGGKAVPFLCFTAR